MLTGLNLAMVIEASVAVQNNLTAFTDCILETDKNSMNKVDLTSKTSIMDDESDE